MRKNNETSAEEMGRLIRVIGGKALAGEKDEQLRARAARRLGISESRAKVLWYCQTANIRADEMDRARELAFVQPIEEAISAVETAERFLEGLRQRLASRAGAVGSDGSLGVAEVRQRRAPGRIASSHLDSARLEVFGTLRSAARRQA